MKWHFTSRRRLQVFGCDGFDEWKPNQNVKHQTNKSVGQETMKRNKTQNGNLKNKKKNFYPGEY